MLDGRDDNVKDEWEFIKSKVITKKEVKEQFGEKINQVLSGSRHLF